MSERRSRRERMSQIIQMLQLQNAAGIRELARKLSVSEATIRRDLTLLAHDDIVTLMHSGAVLNPGSRESYQPRYSLAEAGAQRVAAKLAIGRRAAELLEEEDTVIIDSGSTTECLARNIPMEMSLTLICFALNILVEAHRREHCRVVLCGGALHENTLMFESPEGVQTLRRYRANKAFISAGGVSEKLGVTCFNPYEVDAKRASLNSSQKRILLADGAKFGRVQAGYFADLADFDVVVTDESLSQEYREILAQAGITLLLA
jgi:DeoR family deoxyribose operon repressor